MSTFSTINKSWSKYFKRKFSLHNDPTVTIFFLFDLYDEQKQKIVKVLEKAFNLMAELNDKFQRERVNFFKFLLVHCSVFSTSGFRPSLGNARSCRDYRVVCDNEKKAWEPYKGLSINDVTQFRTFFDPPSPHCHTFHHWGLSTVVTKFFPPKTVTSFMDDP
jgi:hypothetical protein